VLQYSVFVDIIFKRVKSKLTCSSKILTGGPTSNVYYLISRRHYLTILAQWEAWRR